MVKPPHRVIVRSVDHTCGQGCDLNLLTNRFPKGPLHLGVQEGWLGRGLGPTQHLLLVADQDYSISAGQGCQGISFASKRLRNLAACAAHCAVGVLK